MLSYYKRLLREHTHANIAKYFSLILCLFVGITAGALFVTVLSNESVATLVESINLFCSEALVGDATFTSALQSSLVNNFRVLIMLMIGSFSLLTVPLIYVTIAARGFVAGFTVGFMSMHFGLGGVLLAATAVLPQSVTQLPVLLFFAVLCLRRAFSAGRNTRTNIKTSFERKRDRNFRFTYYLAIISVAIALTSCVSALLLSELSKVISGIIMQ